MRGDITGSTPYACVASAKKKKKKKTEKNQNQEFEKYEKPTLATHALK